VLRLCRPLIFYNRSHMPEITEVRRQAGRIEELVGKLEASADPGSLAVARELVQSLLDLYGAGFARVAEALARKGAPGREILEELGRDELVGNLLAANGLHPVDFDARVRGAIERLTGRLRGQGTVELVAINEGGISIRLEVNGSGCGSSAESLKAMVDDAIYEAAPDLTQLSVEVVERGAASGFVPLEALRQPSAANGAGHSRSALL